MLYVGIESKVLIYGITAAMFFSWVTGYCLWNARQQRRIREDKLRRQSRPQIWEWGQSGGAILLTGDPVPGRGGLPVRSRG